jgi:leader peptidase (prepilin peptidase)/N-methyltransferase
LLLTFGVIAAAIVAFDIRTLRAPNAIVYPAAAALALATLPLGWGHAAEALAGGALAFVALLAVALAGRGARGLGDVKAGCLCGIGVGLNGIILMLVSAFVAGGLLAAFALALRVRGRKDVVPFTPFLIFGSFMALALGNGYLVR